MLISAIVRNNLGAPVQLATPTAIAPSLDRPASVNWVDSSSVAVLNVASGTFATPTMVTVGGSMVSLSPISDAVDFFAATSTTAIYVLTSGNDLFVRKGGGWSLFSPNVTAALFVE